MTSTYDRAQAPTGRSYFDHSLDRCNGEGDATPVNPPPVGRSNASMGAPATPPQAAPVRSDVAKQNYGGQNIRFVDAPLPQTQDSGPMLTGPNSKLVEVSERQIVRSRKEDIDAAFGQFSDRILKRRFYISFDFSLAEAASNPKVVTAAPAADANWIFQYRNPDTNKKIRVGDLGTGIIMSLKLLEWRSTVNLALAVAVSGVRGNLYSFNGQRAPHIITRKGKKSYDPNGVLIHRITEVIDIKQLERYGHLTLEDIKATVLPSPKDDVSFVTLTSPIIYVVRRNAELLKIDPKEILTFEDDWYVIQNDIIMCAIESIRRGFFERTPYVSMKEFSLVLSRADKKKWSDASGLVPYNAQNEQALAYVQQKKNTVEIIAEMEFLLVNSSV